MNRFFNALNFNYLQPHPHFEPEDVSLVVAQEQVDAPFAAVGFAGGEKMSKGKSMLSKKSHTV